MTHEGRASFRRRLSLVPLAAWAALLVLAPNVLMLVYSLWRTREGVLYRVFTFDNYIAVVTNDVTLAILGRTVAIAVGAALLATAVAYPMAWFVVRRLS
ncbi:MAG: hypothetical protein NTU77_01725, partial [Actinobacteria bacterium]|nr:hypothetical protein [Actinomycetota bacterium]